MSKKENKIKGNFGENIAYDFLEKEGYRIITRNFNCLYGEIDIIATKNQEIVFIEVKTRCQNHFGEPIEAVNSDKKYHIYNVAKYYLYKSNLLNAPIRFDIIEVYISDSKHYKISHIKDVICEEPKKIRRNA